MEHPVPDVNMNIKVDLKSAVSMPMQADDVVSPTSKYPDVMHFPLSIPPDNLPRESQDCIENLDLFLQSTGVLDFVQVLRGE